MKGLPFTSGFKPNHGNAGAYDAEVYKRLRDAGGLFIGKTNLPEFGYYGGCEGHDTAQRTTLSSRVTQPAARAEGRLRRSPQVSRHWRRAMMARGRCASLVALRDRRSQANRWPRAGNTLSKPLSLICLPRSDHAHRRRQRSYDGRVVWSDRR